MNVILCPNFDKNLNKESVYIFSSNCRTNVETMDSLTDIEYDSGDSQGIIDNIMNILSPLNSQEVFSYLLKYTLE